MPSGSPLKLPVHNAELLGKNYNQTSHIKLLDSVKQIPPKQTNKKVHMEPSVSQLVVLSLAFSHFQC